MSGFLSQCGILLGRGQVSMGLGVVLAVATIPEVETGPPADVALRVRLAHVAEVSVRQTTTAELTLSSTDAVVTTDRICDASVEVSRPTDASIECRSLRRCWLTVVMLEDE